MCTHETQVNLLTQQKIHVLEIARAYNPIVGLSGQYNLKQVQKATKIN